MSELLAAAVGSKRSTVPALLEAQEQARPDAPFLLSGERRWSYAEALAIYQELGLRERAADQCTNIAYARFMKKDYDEALRWYREALSLYTETDSEEKRKLTPEDMARLAAALEEPTE